MVIQKKTSAKEKEAYASSFEIVVLLCDFLTHGGIKWPPYYIFLSECSTNLLYNGTIVAPWNASKHPCKQPKTRGLEI